MPEADRDQALRLREQYVYGNVELRAPGLITYEVGNALRFHPNATEAVSSAGVKALHKMQVTLDGLPDDLLGEAMHIAYVEDVSFYDAVYLALAEHEDTKLITADEQLAKRLKKHRKHVLLLKDYPP